MSESGTNRLFICLYLDEDVSTLIADLLRSRGFEATTTLEAWQLGQSDEAQLQFAADHRLAVLTHNRKDFETLYNQWLSAGRSHSGIIIAVRRKPHDIARRLLRLLNETTADELDNQLRYV